jgi:diguanylate cyclase (GGDEF)-like protein/PAS domain S-box-containing protein
VSETKKSNEEAEQRRLAEAARRYQDFTALSRDWYWEMNDQFQFSYFSKEFEEATGISLSGILGKNRWEGLAAKEYGEVDWEGHIQTLKAHKAFYGFEYPSRTLPGRIFWFRTSGKARFDEDGNFVGYFGIGSDVTAFKNIEDNLRETNAKQQNLISELEQAHAELERKHGELRALSEELRVISITDPLTGAFNRRFFLESTAKMVSFARRHRHPLSILMLDIDHFKKINDVHGHLAGDKVLQTLTDLWKESLRDEDIFARFGGEEFIIALPNADLTAAIVVAERLRISLLGQPVELDGTSLQVTVSTGVSQYQPDEESIHQTLKRADEALYAAKNDGRNRVVSK